MGVAGDSVILPPITMRSDYQPYFASRPALRISLGLKESLKNHRRLRSPLLAPRKRLSLPKSAKPCINVTALICPVLRRWCRQRDGQWCRQRDGQQLDHAGSPRPTSSPSQLTLTCPQGASPGSRLGVVESTFPLGRTDVPSPCQESGRGLNRENIVLWQSPASMYEDFSFLLLLLWFGSMKMVFCRAWISSAQIYSGFFSCAHPNIQVPPWCRNSCPARGDVSNAVLSPCLPNQTNAICVFIFIPDVWCPRHWDSSCHNNKEFSIIVSKHSPPRPPFPFDI